MKKAISVIAFCLFCLFVPGSTVYGQGVWAEKPYQQWTLKEALKILSESPWVQFDQLLDASAFLPSDTLRTRAAEKDDPTSEFFREIVRLRRENDEILYFFPRADDKGNVLITAENKAFGFTANGKMEKWKNG